MYSRREIKSPPEDGSGLLGDPMPSKKMGKAGHPKASKTSKKVRSSPKTSTVKSNAAVAHSTVRKNPTSLALGMFRDREHGEGIRLSGQQLVTTLAADSSTNAVLFSTSSTAVCSANQSILSPDYLNGRLAALAMTFDRYRFRSVIWEYEPTCATSQTGAMMLAFVQDGYASGVFTNSYANLSEVSPSKSIPFRERGSLEYRYDGERVWFTEFDTATTSGARQCAQGMLLGFPSVAGLNASFGVLRIRYVIELFGNVPSLGGVISSLTPDEKVRVANFVKSLRSTLGYEKKESKDSINPVPLERDDKSGLRAPPSTPSTSGSTSSASSGVTSASISQGWFRA